MREAVGGGEGRLDDRWCVVHVPGVGEVVDTLEEEQRRVVDTRPAARRRHSKDRRVRGPANGIPLHALISIPTSYHTSIIHAMPCGCVHLLHVQRRFHVVLRPRSLGSSSHCGSVRSTSSTMLYTYTHKSTQSVSAFISLNFTSTSL